MVVENFPASLVCAVYLVLLTTQSKSSTLKWVTSKDSSVGLVPSIFGRPLLKENLLELSNRAVTEAAWQEMKLVAPHHVATLFTFVDVFTSNVCECLFSFAFVDFTLMELLLT